MSISNSRLLAGLAALVFAAAADAHPGSGLHVDARGRVFFVDTGGGIFRIDGPGQLTRVSGPAFHWMAIDGDGRFAKTRLPSTPDQEMKAVGSDPTLILASDFPIVVSEGALFFPEPGNDQRLRIVRLTPDGVKAVRATLPPSTESGPLRWLGGLASGPDGSLWYTEERALRRVAKDGALTTIASGVAVADCTKVPGYAAGSGPDLRVLGVAADGTAFVAASGCGAVLRITPRGEVTTVLRTVSPWTPTGVAVSGGDVFVLEYLLTASDDRRERLPRVRKVAKDRTISTLAAIDHR